MGWKYIWFHEFPPANIKYITNCSLCCRNTDNTRCSFWSIKKKNGCEHLLRSVWYMWTDYSRETLKTGSKYCLILAATLKKFQDNIINTQKSSIKGNCMEKKSRNFDDTIWWLMWPEQLENSRCNQHKFVARLNLANVLQKRITNNDWERTRGRIS